MTEYIGGLRLRLIKDSFYYMLKDSLTELGWFDSRHTQKPVTLIPEQVNTQIEIKPNVIGVASENLDGREMEMGSNLAENTWEMYIDILAEDEAIGVHLSGDIFDILRGKISAISRTRQSFEVKDLYPNQDTTIFTCQLENIVLNRVRDWERPYNKYWWVIGCEIIDTYYDDQI